MQAENPLSLTALLVVACDVLWFFIKARTHFNDKSPRTPVMFGLEALSAAICVGTVYVVISNPTISTTRSATAILLAILAGVLFSSALRATRERNFGVVFGRTLPLTVVQEGPYAYVRHPLYTAYILTWIACAVLSASRLITAALFGIVGLYLIAARLEERDLLKSDLGPAYKQYRSVTGLLVPRLWGRSRGSRH